MKRLFAIFLAQFFITANFTITDLAAVYIIGDLGANRDIANYTVSFFGLGSALSVPLGRHFAKRYGAAKAYSTCLFLFALFSLLCALSPNYPCFILLRFCLGLVTAPAYAISTLLLNRLSAPHQATKILSLSITILAVGPVLGTAWGGWIAYDFNWRWLFYCIVPFLLLLAFSLRSLIPSDTPQEDHSIDKVGYVFYFLGTGALSSALILGQELDWLRSKIIVALLIVGAVCLLYFILRDCTSSSPLLNLKLLKCPILLFSLVNVALLFSVYFGTLLLLGLWLSLDVNYTPMWIGTAIGTMAIAGLFPRFLIEEKFGKLDPRIPLFAAICFLAISSFHTTIFNEEVNFGRIALSRVTAGFGLALFLPPLARLSYASHFGERALDVLKQFHVVRFLSSGLGASLFSTLWQRRQVFYHERYGEDLTAFSQTTNQYFSDASQFQFHGEKSLAELNDLLNRRSTVFALDDCFYLMGYLMIALLVYLMFSYLFFSRKERPDLSNF